MNAYKKLRTLLTPRDRNSALTLLALMFIGMVLEILGVSAVMPVIAVLTEGDIANRYPQLRPLLDTLGNPTQARLVASAVLLLVAIYLSKAVFLAFLAWRQNKFAADLHVQLAQRLFTIYLRQPYTFHLQRNSAQLMRNINSETAVFGTLLRHGVTLITEGLVLLGIGGLLLLVAPLSAIIVVLLLGTAAVGFHYSTRRQLARWGSERLYHEGLRFQHLVQGLSAAKDVKLLGRERDFLDQYRVHHAQSERVGQLQGTLSQLPRLWLELLAVGAVAAVVLTMLAQRRDMHSIVAVLGVFTVAAFRLMPSVNRILGAVQYLPYGRPVIDTLYEEFKLPSPEPVKKGISRVFHGEIRLSNIEYTYSAAPAPALSGMTLTVQKGESVGFTGPTGSGKSTLVDVILGLFPPDSGEVTVDGQDIRRDLRAWQDQIGYVPQSIYLTDDTLRRNVAFGLANDEIDDAAVRRAIVAAQLEQFVGSLPHGLETLVGERGVRLSGGERQRVGIARALYHDPRVLVLDEATSALDTVTERHVMQAVEALRGSKTILIVAHRLSAIEHCNRLYRLERGRLVAEGAPSKVLGAKSTGFTRIAELTSRNVR